MISNTLQHKNPQANFLKLINHQEETITTNPTEIKNSIENYYSNLYKPNSLQPLPPTWKKTYQPIPSIKHEFYKDLLIEITTNEILQTISQSTNNKAPGPSQISFDIIKKITNPETLNFLKILFNNIIKEGKIPNQWKQQSIYPISKKLEWRYNIQETRPIALLDTFRKIFTKILTNRLSKIFLSHKILQGHNFAGLPNQGTFQPIQILNSIYNTAKLNKDELWILSLDIKAAFDSVSNETISNSMNRLKIPQQFTNLIIDILTDRKCSIITSHGPTNNIAISKGIPQGETISPLLWTIFYDPLLTKLNESKKHIISLTTLPI